MSFDPSVTRATMIARSLALTHHISLSHPVIGLLSQSDLSHTLLAVIVQQYDKNTLLTQRDVGSRPTGGIDYEPYTMQKQKAGE